MLYSSSWRCNKPLALVHVLNCLLPHRCCVAAADINIFWHPQGDYLAVKVDRFTKTRKSTYTGFELFSIREKGIPMDVSYTPCCVAVKGHACMPSQSLAWWNTAAYEWGLLMFEPAARGGAALS